MNHPQPVLNQLDLVVRDIDVSVAFYRRLGLEIPDTAVWRTASGAHHVDLVLSNGFHFHLDSSALAKSFDRGWPAVDATGTCSVIGFAVGRVPRSTTATRSSSPPGTRVASRRTIPSGEPATR